MAIVLRLIISLLVSIGVFGLFTAFIMILKQDKRSGYWLMLSCFIWSLVTFLFLSR